jgi:hypothetical protein
MTKGKVLKYIDSHQQIKDSIESKILRDNPCPSLDTDVSIGKTDTSGLNRYYNEIDNAVNGIGDYVYLPSTNPLASIHDTVYKERLIKPNIDSLKKYIGKDTVKLPVDPRILKTMNLSLKMVEDSLTKQHDVITKLTQTITDKTAENKAKDKWLYLFIGLFVIDCIYVAFKLFVK